MPAARLGRPEEYGDLVAFVCSDRAGYLNGTVIDYVTSMQGSGFTFKNPTATGCALQRMQAPNAPWSWGATNTCTTAPS